MQSSRFRDQSTFRSILNDLLIHINYNRIYLPYNDDIQILAAKARNDEIQNLTAVDLMKWNIKREANLLNIYNQLIINMATDHIWNFSTNSQRDQLVTLANNVNQINQNHALLLRIVNNEDTLDRINQLTEPQVANNNEFEYMYIFNGT